MHIVPTIWLMVELVYNVYYAYDLKDELVSNAYYTYDFMVGLVSNAYYVYDTYNLKVAPVWCKEIETVAPAWGK